MFTEYGINQIKNVKVNFKNLWEYYDEFVGNFSFTEEELKENYVDALKWMKENNNYFLLFEEGYENGKCFFLTEVE